MYEPRFVYPDSHGESSTSPITREPRFGVYKGSALDPYLPLEFLGTYREQADSIRSLLSGLSLHLERIEELADRSGGDATAARDGGSVIQR